MHQIIQLFGDSISRIHYYFKTICYPQVWNLEILNQSRSDQIFVVNFQKYRSEIQQSTLKLNKSQVLYQEISLVLWNIIYFHNLIFFHLIPKKSERFKVNIAKITGEKKQILLTIVHAKKNGKKLGKLYP